MIRVEILLGKNSKSIRSLGKIGVNLSKEIIERHNGTLTYESEKYIGTNVIIELPLDPELNNF